MVWTAVGLTVAFLAVTAATLLPILASIEASIPLRLTSPRRARAIARELVERIDSTGWEEDYSISWYFLAYQKRVGALYLLYGTGYIDLIADAKEWQADRYFKQKRVRITHIPEEIN